ncbi:MAG: glycerol-3-phosphate acyltransferase, partial [Eikenella corrodens]|nr:glycerol-3-phosphate acyltransferase [Eikenella corrodens]
LVAVLLARWLQSHFGLADEVVAAVAVAVLAGHMWPLFFGFKGGKGVATALGVLLALSWPVALICAAVWLIMAFGLKISSLAALAATVISPLAAMFLVQQPSWQATIAVIAALVLLRHRSNIQNLLSGKESKIGSGK